jgi:hypothetical protein
MIEDLTDYEEFNDALELEITASDRMIEITETQRPTENPSVRRAHINVERESRQHQHQHPRSIYTHDHWVSVRNSDDEERSQRTYTNVRPHPSQNPPAGRPTENENMTDGMGRDIQTGDILTWNSGGYYNNFMSYGIVKDIHDEHGRIRVINHRGKGVNIWVTQNTVIIAKRDNYESIPDDFLRKFGVI